MILELQQEKDHSSMESVKSFFGGKSKDFITAVDEKSIIIVKELEEERDMQTWTNCLMRSLILSD